MGRAKGRSPPLRGCLPLAGGGGRQDFRVGDLENFAPGALGGDLVGDLLADAAGGCLAVLQVLFRIPNRSGETHAAFPVHQKDGRPGTRLSLNERYDGGFVARDALIDLGGITFNGRYANPDVGCRRLKALLHRDFTLMVIDDAAAGRGQDLYCLRANLLAGGLHRLLRLPIGDGHALARLTVRHEGRPKKSLLLLDQRQNLRRPVLDGLLRLARVAFRSDHAAVHSATSSEIAVFRGYPARRDNRSASAPT